MITSKFYDERRALYELAEGNENAFVWLFDQYSPRVYRAALKFLGSREAAEEIVQEVFMDIWVRKEKMPEVLNLGAYIHGMTKNQVFDSFRRQNVAEAALEELRLADWADNPTDRMMLENEYERLLQEAVGELPEHHQQIFRLAREEGLSHEAIAEQMNLTRLAVKAHMKRILFFLRSRLKPVLRAELHFLLLSLLLD